MYPRWFYLLVAALSLVWLVIDAINHQWWHFYMDCFYAVVCLLASLFSREE